MTSRSFLSVKPASSAGPAPVPNTLSNQESVGGASRQPPDIALGTGDLMSRVLATMPSQRHINPLVLMGENLEPMQKKRYKKRIDLKRYVPPKIEARNSELQKKRRKLWMQKVLHQMLPRQAVEASRPNLPMPAADQRQEVKIQLPKLHSQRIKHRQSLLAARGAEDPTQFPESGDLGATPVKILLTRPTGRILTSAELYDDFGQEELERIGSPCVSCTYAGGMPQLKSCADFWNESGCLKKF